MPSVCFYFQVHQPFRLGRFSQIRPSPDHQYFDDAKNAQIMRKVAEKCYLPANAKILDLIDRFKGEFRVAYSISGVAIEQMEMWAPEVLESFIELANTGCVEFLGETYYHSLASVYDPEEFRQQVKKHADLMLETFGVEPRVFRNTELIYSDHVGRLVSAMGYQGVIAEGADDVLQWRSPNFVYLINGSHTHPERIPTRLLLKNYRLSDDIAFRFSNRSWEGYPLTADKFASWVHRISGNGETVNLFMDYETFGEHQWASTGIFDFLDHLPAAILRHGDWDFLTPTEVIRTHRPVAELSVPRVTSWADVDRDLTAWQGNNMQRGALDQAYSVGPLLREYADEQTLDTWRRLLTSDHYYYMCTKWFADGDVHAYFSPYESPYEAFVNFMNVFKDFRRQIEPILAGREVRWGASM